MIQRYDREHEDVPLEECAAEFGPMVLYSDHDAALAARDEVNDRLKQLVLHCWVHSGYQDCGYSQMTTEQKQLYDEIKQECEEKELTIPASEQGTNQGEE